MLKLIKNLNLIWSKFKGINEDLWNELEEQLIAGDVSVSTAADIIEKVKEKSNREKINDPDQLKSIIKKQITDILSETAFNNKLNISDKKPAVFLIVGVNGTGKTSTIGKIAKLFKDMGKKVLIAAADTYRSAAVEQIEYFADQLDIELIHHQRNSDPGAVVYDSLERALARDIDLVIIDTAGRMQTSYNLMEELKKIKKIILRKTGKDAEEILLVIDSTTGQNAKVQAELFNQALGLTGIILTKIDGTSKGGIILTIKNDLNIPVKMVTRGEKITDINYFNPSEFVDMLFS